MKATIYAEIPFTVEGRQCLTPCPYRDIDGKPARVFSLFCLWCRYYVGSDLKNRIVRCSHPDVRN